MSKAHIILKMYAILFEGQRLGTETLPLSGGENVVSI